MGTLRYGSTVAVLVMLGATAQASPLDMFGFGARSAALAGTGVASATDYDAVYLNPAGLADIPRKRLTIGGMGGDLFLYLDDQRADTDTITGAIFGGAVPLPLGGALRDRVGLGLGFHVPTAAINRARHPVPGTPVFALLDSRSFVVAVQGAVGVKLGTHWRAGLGVLALAALRGRIDVVTDASGRFTTSSEQQLITRITPIIGVRRLMPERALELGLVVRGASSSEYDILVTSDLGSSIPLTLPPVRIAGTAQYDPATVAVEAAWRWRPDIQFGAQLAYQRWSAYPLPTSNPVDGTPPQEPPGFHDIVVPRLAMEWTHANDRYALSVRGGYGFVLSPAPEMTGQQSLLDNHRHILAAGVGLAFAGARVPLYIDGWMQMHVLMPRSHTKDPARFASEDEMPFATIHTRGRILAGGLTMGVDL